MTVTVNRNLYAPHFENENLKTTIMDSEALASSIIRVTAVDDDIQVCRDTLIIQAFFVILNRKQQCITCFLIKIHFISCVIGSIFKNKWFQSPHNEISYSLAGDSTALEYFMVDETTGYISLKKSVALDPQRRTQYNVCNCQLSTFITN